MLWIAVLVLDVEPPVPVPLDGVGVGGLLPPVPPVVGGGDGLAYTPTVTFGANALTKSSCHTGIGLPSLTSCLMI